MREPANRDNPKAAAVAKDRAVLGYLPKEQAPTSGMSPSRARTVMGRGWASPSREGSALH